MKNRPQKSCAHVATLILLWLFCATYNVSAIIDSTLQMQLGNPSGAIVDPNNHSHYLIQRTVEAIDYNDSNGEPNWASWDLTASDIGSATRSTSFFTDSTLPSTFYHVTSSDYTSSGYDRGHMCPSADRTDNDTDNNLVFYMSNIIPQAPDNNQGPWEALETYCRTLAQSGNELLIISGPSTFSGSRIQPSGKVAIPGYTWKIIVVVPSGAGSAISRINASTRVITVKMPNVQGIRSINWTNYNTTPNQIQADTGYTFFTALDPTLAATLRAKNDAGGSAPPTPTITSFSPTSGPVGQSVTISGTGFTGASFVRFNGTDAASFTVNSSTSITATVATGSSTGPITVTTGGGVATSASSFTVNGGTPAPSITSFTPTSGTAGTSVTITGSSFTGATTVAFNGAGATFTVNSDTSITATVPSAASSGAISVTTAAGTGTSASSFTVSGTGAGKVVISQVYGGGGNTGATYKNDFIELYNSGSTSVDLSTYAVQYASAAGSTWQATTLSGSIAAGHYYLVQEAAGTGGTQNLPTPDATGTISMSASAAKIALTKTTTLLTVDNPIGNANLVDFVGYGTADAFEGSGAAPAPSATASDLRAGNGATDTDNNAADFATGAVNPRNSATGGTPAPSITSFSPTSGNIGTSVTITGANFTGATAVKFNGTSATTFTVNSSTQITATVPSGATTGTISVTTAGGTATSATSFTVTAPAPSITSFTPTSGPIGTSVTITGANFTGASAVKFNGTSATTFTVTSATQITATVPSGATTGTISVTTAGGTATSASSFTVIPPPSITSFSPTSGPIGASVTITGANFTGATAVKFNGTSATTFTVNSATQITATVPSGATTGTISVTTAGGTGTSASSFTVVPAPSITSFSPASGAVGQSVVITGANFSGATATKFNGTTATFTVNSSTQITATVPSGATTGTISVTTAGGTATSGTSFTVTNGVGTVVISQIYGGGGNSGATYKNDFIELYNRGTGSVDLSTYAVQYASATGSTWQETTLTGTLLPGHYYLIQEAAGTGGTANLPTPQAIGTISMSATAGKIALTKTQTLLTVSNPVGGANVVDFIGYGTADAFEGTGAAPAPSNTTSDLRAGNGATDTNNNATDFTTGTVNPRNQ